MTATYNFDIVGQRSRRLSSSTKDKAVFEKDILRIGQWKTQSGVWNVTADVLTDIVKNFQQFRMLGNHIPVKLNHSDDVRDTVGEVVRLRVEGDTLIARLSIADEETIERIGKTFNEVSVEVREPFIDGKKNHFNIMVTHLAIVDIPVVNNQAPFRRMLSNMSTFMKSKVRRLQNEDEVIAEDDAMPDIGTVEFRIKAINTLLKAAGSAVMIPDDTTEENFDSVLKTLMQTVEMQTGTESPSETLEDGIDPDANPSDEFLSLKGKLEEADKRIASLQAEREKEKCHAFSLAIDNHISLGRIAPARKDELMKQGKANKYQLAMLSPYDDIPPGSVVPTKSVIKTIGTPDEKGMSEEEKDAEVMRFLGRA